MSHVLTLSLVNGEIVEFPYPTKDEASAAAVNIAYNAIPSIWVHFQPSGQPPVLVQRAHIVSIRVVEVADETVPLRNPPTEELTSVA